MIVTFFGHAQFPKADEYRQKIVEFLDEQVGDQAADLYLGGYGEFDHLAYECCKQYQKTHSGVSLFLITPYMTKEYQKNHLNDQQVKYDGIIYPEIEDKPLRYAISYRNQWMIEKADYVVCGICHDWGGAYQAYRYAKRKKKYIFNVMGKAF